MNEVIDLETLLSKRLGEDRKITNIEKSTIPAKGYGSLMLKIKVKVKSNKGEEELHLVAKKIPVSEEARKAFNIYETFKTEVEFYRTVVPALKEFENEENITDVLNCFPEFYGARYNLHGNNDEVDENGVLLLEDLTVKGFGNLKREVGVDLKAAESILQNLAKFHGTVIALKHKKPKILQEKILPHCNKFDFLKNKVMEGIINTLKDLIRTFPDYANFAEQASNMLKKPTPKPREPFGTISHNDLWTNNIMNKIKTNGNIETVFIDFQVYNYRSITTDVFFFLWTSVERKVLENNIDHLLNYYHKQLLKTLASYGIDTALFGYKTFEEDMKAEANHEFGHALAFLFILKFINKLGGELESFKVEVDDINPELKDYIYFMVSECVKRGWLQ